MMLQMMGMRMLETCWAVFKRQAIKLRDWCIWLTDLFEYMMMHGLTNSKFVCTSPVLPLIRTILQSLAREMSGHFLFHFVSVTVQDTSPVLSLSGVRIQVRVKDFSLLRNIQTGPPIKWAPLWVGWGVKLTFDLLLVPRFWLSGFVLPLYL